MDIRPIHTEADYKAALKEISALMAPDPVEAIKFRMDQSGLSVKDLEPIIGKSNRVYEILNRKRPLTLAMIRRLHQRLGIPANVLIMETVVR
jgi:HTH-type transcriptional regulator/antitoxin HigA